MTDTEVLELLKTNSLPQTAKLSGRNQSSVYSLFVKTYPGQRLLRGRLGREYLANAYGKGTARVQKMLKQKQRGLSYTEIGLLQDPPIRRQRVREILRPYLEVKK